MPSCIGVCMIRDDVHDVGTHIGRRHCVSFFPCSSHSHARLTLAVVTSSLHRRYIVIIIVIIIASAVNHRISTPSCRVEHIRRHSETGRQAVCIESSNAASNNNNMSSSSSSSSGLTSLDSFCLLQKIKQISVIGGRQLSPSSVRLTT